MTAMIWFLIDSKISNFFLSQLKKIFIGTNMPVFIGTI
ncbi:MAG: tryptophanase leader peptide [Lachnospiraceae bacterium]